MRDDIRRVRKYELMTIFVPELPEEELQAAITRVSDILTGAEGTVSIINREAPWGRRRLAYPIRHGSRDVRDGFYALYYVELDSQSVLEVERDLKLMDNLMRYLITQQVAEAMIPQSEADEAEDRAAEEAVAAGIVPGGIVAAPEASEPPSGGEAPPDEMTDTSLAAEAIPEEAATGDEEAGESTDSSDAAPAETIQAEEVAGAALDEPVQAEEVAESGDAETGDGEMPADVEVTSDPVESEDATDSTPVEVGEDAEDEGKE